MKNIEKKFALIGTAVSLKSGLVRSFFPISSEADMDAFLSEEGNFRKKIQAFKDYLLNVVTVDKKAGNAFWDDLFKLLFTKEYAASHRWRIVP